jgi:hypothetical protein
LPDDKSQLAIVGIVAEGVIHPYLVPNGGERLIHHRKRLDRGKIIALWGARRPDQLAPVNEVMGWNLDADAMQEIDGILAETIRDRVGPEFMAPPPTRAVLQN